MTLLFKSFILTGIFTDILKERKFEQVSRIICKSCLNYDTFQLLRHYSDFGFFVGKVSFTKNL